MSSEWQCLCGRWNRISRAFCLCGRFWQRTEDKLNGKLKLR